MNSFLKALDNMLKNDTEKKVKKQEPIYDADGNEMKLTREMFCQGVVFWVGLAGLAVCACLRGCQEYKKHHDAKGPKTVVVAHTETVTNAVHSGIFVRTR